MTALSKSKYLVGLQCPKRLWVRCNDAGRLTVADAATEFRFDQGHLVGQLARQLYPDGIEIEWKLGMEEAVRRTQVALITRRPLFEAAFRYGSACARADVLVPTSPRRWDLLEVKSTGEVKDEHLQDVAFQRYVYEGAGLKIRRCFILHVDTSYLRDGEVEPEKLFTRENITSDVRALLPRVPRRIKRLLSVIQQPKCPKVNVGDHCSEPYACELHDECWAFLPRRSVFSLWRGRAKAKQLRAQNILSLADIPQAFRLSKTQTIQVACAKSRRPHIDRNAICALLRRLRHPLYFLDFETVGTAIPLFTAARPYEQLPFQYSLLVQREPGGPARHHSFLAAGQTDPRLRLLTSLEQRIGAEGSIVSYNAPFEIARLKACAEHFPAHAAWIAAAIPRFVDLWEPFRRFHYHHPRQDGHTGQKAVLPVLTDLGYDDLDIGDGQTAAVSFLELAFGQHDRAERATMREALRRYCRRDVDGMLAIVAALQRLGRRRSR